MENLPRVVAAAATEAVVGSLRLITTQSKASTSFGLVGIKRRIFRIRVRISGCSKSSSRVNISNA